jgi:hypothetical protein
METKVYNFDAIIIPGGGLKEDNKLPVWVRRRLDRALEVQKSEFIITLSAGTTYKPPPRDKDGFPIFESVAAAKYLLARGISEDKILFETCSYDTIGNAFFSKVIHVDPRGLKNLLIITSAFHMPRVKTVFKWIYGLESATRLYDLSFEEVSDEGIPRNILRPRLNKELKSLDKLKITKKNIKSLTQFHEWMFTQHNAYSVSGKRESIGDDILKSY